MADIMVAVAVGTLSILPGFPPMHGGETYEKCARRKWSQQTAELIARKLRSQLKPMFLWRVMVQTRFELQTFQRAKDKIALSRMQIAGRRIAPQCPLRVPRFLPRGERQRQFEKSRQAAHGDRLGGDSLINRLIGGGHRLLVRFQQGKPDECRAVESAKRIGLIRPIEKSQGLRIAVEMM